MGPYGSIFPIWAPWARGSGGRSGGRTGGRAVGRAVGRSGGHTSSVSLSVIHLRGDHYKYIYIYIYTYTPDPPDPTPDSSPAASDDSFHLCSLGAAAVDICRLLPTRVAVRSAMGANIVLVLLINQYK